MTACEKFCEELTDLVFSPVTPEQIFSQAAFRLKRVLGARSNDLLVPTDGFHPSLLDWHNANIPGEEPRHHYSEKCPGKASSSKICPVTGVPCSVKVGNPGCFYAGQMVGRAIKEALCGTIGKQALKHRLMDALADES